MVERNRWATRGSMIVVVGAALLMAGLAGCSLPPPGWATGSTGSTGQGGSAAAGGPGTGGVAAGGAGGGAAGQLGCSISAGPAGAWVEIAAPSGQSGFTVTDAFAAGSDDLLFAGSTAPPGSTPAGAEVLRWTQGCWTVDLAVAPSAANDFPHPSVHGTGPGDLWATASDLLYHRDAHGWARFTDDSWRGLVHLPGGAFGNTLQFNRVRAAAPNDIWIAATSNMLHWSNEAWAAYNFDDPGYPTQGASVGYSFAGIWIDSPSSVWPIGPSDQVGNTMDFAFLHQFDGSGWTHTGLGVDPTVYAIWRAGSVLWLAHSTRALINGQSVAPNMQSFDGTSVTGVVIPAVDPTEPPPTLSSLFGHGDSDLWAAGNDVAHFDGQSWSLVSDAPAAAHAAVDEPTNTFVTGDAGSVWLVTPGPRFFRKVTSP